MQLSSSQIQKFPIFQETEVSNPKTKKFLIFPETELSSLIFREMELSCSNINFSYILSKESFSSISENENPEKIPYISGNGTFLYFSKFLIFQEVTFRARKNKKHLLRKNFLYFRKWNFLALRLRNFLYFRE